MFELHVTLLALAEQIGVSCVSRARKIYVVTLVVSCLYSRPRYGDRLAPFRLSMTRMRLVRHHIATVKGIQTQQPIFC